MLPQNEKIRQYCQLCAEHFLPLFMQPWWMEATCKTKGGWNVLLVTVQDLKEQSAAPKESEPKESEPQKVSVSYAPILDTMSPDRVVGAMPYYLGEKFKFSWFKQRFIIMPQLTQTSGLWIDPALDPELDSELGPRPEPVKAVVCHIESQLKALKLHYFYQQIDESLKAWSQFSSAFLKKERYTYRVDLTKQSAEALEKNMSKNKRRQLKRSRASELVFDEACSPEAFYDFKVHCLAQQGKTMTYSKALFLTLVKTAQKRSQGKIIALRNAKKELVAGVFLVYDAKVCYYLVPSFDLSQTKTGAMASVTLRAMTWAKTQSQYFDFEGSMEASIALSYQQFGGKKVIYHSLERAYSFPMKLYFKLFRH